LVVPASDDEGGQMSQSIRELLTELAWIEDSIRLVPLSHDTAGDDDAVNPDLLALAEREREIISELRASPSRWGSTAV
jgi:hypothetical protein